MKRKRTKQLICGCCGRYFQTWEGYKDQDQDKGFGICSPCQDEAEKRNEAEFDKSIALLSGALNEQNRAKFLLMDRETQKLLVLQAFEDGVLTWSIGGRP